MQGREVMKAWVREALRGLGGSATILDICKRVWERHSTEIREADDLFYNWQYEIRWAGDLLRRDRVIRPAKSSPRGIWELA
jgi:hypothetical protein